MFILILTLNHGYPLGWGTQSMIKRLKVDDLKTRVLIPTSRVIGLQFSVKIIVKFRIGDINKYTFGKYRFMFQITTVL